MSRGCLGNIWIKHFHWSSSYPPFFFLFKTVSTLYGSMLEVIGVTHFVSLIIILFRMFTFIWIRVTLVVVDWLNIDEGITTVFEITSLLWPRCLTKGEGVLHKLETPWRWYLEYRVVGEQTFTKVRDSIFTLSVWIKLKVWTPLSWFYNRIKVTPVSFNNFIHIISHRR